MAQIEQGQLAKSVWKEGRLWKIDPGQADQERTDNLELRRDVSPEDQSPIKPAVEGMRRAARLSLVEAKALTEESRAEIEYLKLQELKGNLVQAADVERERFMQGRQIRDTLMEVPTKKAAELAAISDVHEMELALGRLISGALEAIIKENLGGAA